MKYDSVGFDDHAEIACNDRDCYSLLTFIPEIIMGPIFSVVNCSIGCWQIFPNGVEIYNSFFASE